MPWSKSKGEQLDLVDAAATAPSEPSSIDEAGLGVLEVDESPLSVPCNTSASDSLAGQALVVPIERVHEDPDNPRTEFPEARIAELAEDIRQRGILQPIVVHPADTSDHHRIHFGAMRLRAAKRAGLTHVSVVIRTAAADPYAQVAENQRRCPLEPLELARLIRRCSDAGDSNSTIARQLGMDLTTVAHHLALLDLPAELDQAPPDRTLHLTANALRAEQVACRAARASPCIGDWRGRDHTIRCRSAAGGSDTKRCAECFRRQAFDFPDRASQRRVRIWRCWSFGSRNQSWQKCSSNLPRCGIASPTWPIDWVEPFVQGSDRPTLFIT